MAQLVSWGGQDNLKKGQLLLAQQYADAGMMARAQAAFKAAGGVWDNAIHRLFKKEADETTRYGGDISFKWTDYGVRTQAQLNQIIEWAKQGQFGRIADQINKLGGKVWNKNLHKKLAAEYLGKQEKDTDADKPGWQGTKTTEYKRDEPVEPPKLYPDKTVTGADGDTVVPDWKTQFQGVITPGQVGAWGGGASQQRKDAQKWRTLHMDAALKGAGVTRDAGGKIVKPADISDSDWNAFKIKKNKIAKRHRKMLGVGEWA